MNGRRHRDNAVEVLGESLSHFMAFTAAVGAADVVVPGVLLTVINLGDALAPQIRMMLTAPTIVHDATVVDRAIRIEAKRSAALARRKFDRRGGWVWVGNGIRDGCVVSGVWTRT